ncbi:MAG TPA: hypothetical protein VF914_21080 [Chloroflexia bacterium]
MIPKQDWFCLFFPEPLDETDFKNLEASEVKRVQLFFRAALNRPEMLKRLKAMGVRVTLRLEEPGQDEPVEFTYYGANAWLWVRSGLLQIGQLVNVEAVIVGNEPEQPYDLSWSSANWGNNPDGKWARGKVWHHAFAFEQVRKALADLPVKVVSPGWSCQRMTPNDRPQPGRASWGRSCADAYNGAFITRPEEGEKLATGAHIYVHNWLSDEDINRFKWELANELERCHRVVWINECNSNNGTPLQRMAAVLAMADLVRGHRDGGRVGSFCPFVSNGLGNAYGAGYIMRDPECYKLLGRWLNS